MILIENAYIYRRPFSPGNPNGRRSYGFVDSFAYPAGFIDTVSGGKYTSKSQALAAPNDTLGILATGGFGTIIDISSFGSDVATITNQPKVNPGAGYTLSASFTASSLANGLTSLTLTAEGGGISTSKVGWQWAVHGNTGGNASIHATSDQNITVFDTGIGALTLNVPHTMKVVIGKNASGGVNLRTYAMSIDGVVLASGTIANWTNTGTMFGMMAQAHLPAPAWFNSVSFVAQL